MTLQYSFSCRNILTIPTVYLTCKSLSDPCSQDTPCSYPKHAYIIHRPHSTHPQVDFENIYLLLCCSNQLCQDQNKQSYPVHPKYTRCSVKQNSSENWIHALYTHIKMF